MNRRTVLLALGAVAIMTGVVFGTGAFTQVEADRNVTVNVSDDSAAFLQLEPAAANSEYVSTVAGGAGQQVVEINLDSNSGATGSGVNDDAVTNVTPVLNVTNQGTQDVEVTVTGAPTGVNLTGTPVTVALGTTEQIGIEVAAGNAPRDINNGTIGGNIDQPITITAEATP